MQVPPHLQKGDRVAIVSTARKVSPEEMAPAIKKLQHWGLEPVEGVHLYREDRQFAGTVEERRQDLQWALDDPSIRGVLCARGGYGTVQLIDRIDFASFRAAPKWIIGYSDVTVLHSHINRHFGIATIHGPMAIDLGKDSPEALEALWNALFLGLDGYCFQGKPSLDSPGRAKGALIGGNLSILYSLTGTDSMFDAAGKVLFIEDLDEYLYHIDRMMQNLRKSAVLDRIEGLLVGGLTQMNDNQVPYGKTAETIVAETMSDHGVPVGFGFPAGHMPQQRALYFGVEVELDVGDQGGRLSFL